MTAPLSETKTDNAPGVSDEVLTNEQNFPKDLVGHLPDHSCFNCLSLPGKDIFTCLLSANDFSFAPFLDSTRRMSRGRGGFSD